MKSKLHAPKTGVGNSAGLKPPATAARGMGTANAKNSDGMRKPCAADRKGAAHESSGREPKAGPMAIMRKPY